MIDLDAYTANIHALRSIAGDDVSLMAVLASVIWIEKSWRHGEQMARAAGAAAIAAGAIMAVTSAI